MLLIFSPGFLSIAKSLDTSADPARAAMEETTASRTAASGIFQIEEDDMLFIFGARSMIIVGSLYFLLRFWNA